MRMFRAKARMLVRRRASWVLMIALMVIMTMAFAAAGAMGESGGAGPGAGFSSELITFPDAFDQVLAFMIGLGGLFAVIYGAAVAGSEWGWGTLKLATTRGENRALYMLLSFAAVAALLVVGILLIYLVGVVAALMGATAAGISTEGLTDSAALAELPLKLAKAWIVIASEAAIGFAIATIARSQLAGIGVGIALYFGGTFLALFLPEVVKWLPFNAASAALGGGGADALTGGMGGDTLSLDPTVAMVVIVAWLVGALALTGWYIQRAEIDR